jgi:hypothetical protein
LLDHGGVGRLQHDALTGLEHMVFGVAAPRDPDLATAHRELAAQVVDPQGLPPERLKDCPLTCVELRFHHQSPVACQMPLHPTWLYDRRETESNPMKTVDAFDADLI